MFRPSLSKFFTLLAVIFAAWLGLRFLLPLAMPFILGCLLALAAEPGVHFATGKLKLPRGLCAGVCVSATLVLLLSLMVLLGSLILRQLSDLANAMPDVEQTARQGLTSLEDLLLRVAYRAPEGIRPLLTKSVLSLFSGGNQMVEQVTRRIPAVASSFLSHVPDGALTLITAVLSAFMVSARLPKLKAWFRESPAVERARRWLPALGKVRRALAGWLKAQLRLSGTSFLILLAGFFLLRVPRAPIWAFLVALVDAVPLLGTGTVLVPWALVCLLKGSRIRGIALLALYAVTALTRSVMEPRLLGRQLGLDPLVTLLALYTGFKLWGVAGMLLAPVLSVAARELTSSES